MTIGRLFFTQLFTSVIGIPISLYHLGTSSSQRFRVLPLGRRPSDWITCALLWGTVGAILLTCDHHLNLFLFAVCSAGCMFTRRIMSSFLILSILVRLYYMCIGGYADFFVPKYRKKLVKYLGSLQAPCFDILFASSFPNKYTP